MYDDLSQSSYGPLPQTGPALPPESEGVTAPGWYLGHKLANGGQRLAAAFLDYWLPFIIASQLTNLFNWGGIELFFTWFLLVFVNLYVFADERQLARSGDGFTDLLDGQSLGKWALRLTAVQPRMDVRTGETFLLETRFLTMVIRATLHFISWPIVPISLLFIFRHPRRQSFADRATGTLVLCARPSKISGLYPAKAIGLGPQHQPPASVRNY